MKEVRRYLGMWGFYRKHIPEFLQVATPLTNLTRHQVDFKWTPACQNSFDQLKSLLTQAPILVKADVNQLFIITTGASNTHVGGVLRQIQPDNSNKPIAYFSKKTLRSRKRNSE